MSDPKNTASRRRAVRNAPTFREDEYADPMRERYSDDPLDARPYRRRGLGNLFPLAEGLYQAAMESAVATSEVLSDTLSNFALRDRSRRGIDRRFTHLPLNVIESTDDFIEGAVDIPRRVWGSYMRGRELVYDMDDRMTYRRTVRQPETHVDSLLYAPPGLGPRLRSYVPEFDEAATDNLWTQCVSRAGDCRVEDVVYCFRIKADELLTPDVAYPVGLLLVEVPKCFEGDDPAYLTYRQAEVRRNQQYVRKQAAVDAEVAHFRAEQEAVLNDPKATPEAQQAARRKLGLGPA